ncbi:MAG: nitroreductase family protein [Eubacteriales bacterium]|nr:nitroreductase family protein [Eubacteriales bacterium]
MEFNEVAASRRSIRKYDGTRKVTEEQIREMIGCAIYAPSWKNTQTARYYVAYSAEMIEKVRGALPAFNNKSTEGASAYIVTAVKANVSGYEKDGTPTTELDNNAWGIYDLGMHNQNLILKAAELGLGTLVMGIRDVSVLKEIFEIPEEQIVVSVIAVGYPDIDAKMPPRKSVEDIAVIR